MEHTCFCRDVSHVCESTIIEIVFVAIIANNSKGSKWMNTITKDLTLLGLSLSLIHLKFRGYASNSSFSVDIDGLFG
jgi:hypothetical protein